jgi:hypothetical protein
MVDDEDDQPKVSLLFAVAAGTCLYRTCVENYAKNIIIPACPLGLPVSEN